MMSFSSSSQERTSWFMSALSHWGKRLPEGPAFLFWSVSGNLLVLVNNVLLWWVFIGRQQQNQNVVVTKWVAAAQMWPETNAWQVCIPSSLAESSCLSWTFNDLYEPNFFLIIQQTSARRFKVCIYQRFKRNKCFKKVILWPTVRESKVWAGGHFRPIDWLFVARHSRWVMQMETKLLLTK